MATKVRWVSDEVWAALDPKAGVIRGAELKRLVVGAVLLMAVLVAAGVLWVAGLVHPRLAWSHAEGYGSENGDHVFATDVSIVNNGWIDVRITGVGQDGPGLKLISVSDRTDINTYAGRKPPFTLHPGQTAVVSLRYQVTDCAAVPAGAFDVPVRVERLWGTQTMSIAVPRGSAMPSGGSEEEWQHALAGAACRVHH